MDRAACQRGLRGLSRAGGDKDGRRFGGPPKPYEPPEVPEGKINVTDPDSRLVKGTRGWLQGYSAQAATNEQQIVIAAEITVDSPDFGHLEPVLDAARRELGGAGVTDTPDVVLADAGDWHQDQMQRIVAAGIQALIPPDSSRRKAPRPGWDGGLYAFMRRVLDTDRGGALQHERYRSHRAVRAVLERLAAAAPLVLVLDDLHWADAASVELLGALLRRPPAAPVLMALGVRPRQLSRRLAAATDRAYGDARLTRVELGALSRGEARELLGADVDGAVADALYDDSGGNPFYLEQLARSLDRTAGGPASVVGPLPSDLDVPPAVAAALADELTVLSDSAQLALEGAAVAGDPFEPELAAAAAATSEAAAMAALDELLGLDLVHGTEVPRRFRFRHPLIRRAVYVSTPAGWRLGAHARCAEALEARGASATARAHHVERSARQGDAAAVATLREAGDAAAQRAPASAATWFGHALRLLPDAAPAAVRVELLLSRARALVATGQFADGHAALLHSIGLVPTDAVALRVRLTTACAGVEHLLGRHDQAHARLAGVMASLRDPRSPEAAVLMIELAMDGFFRMDYDVMREWAERALATARPLSDRPLVAAAVAVLAFANATSGATPEADARRSEAVALVADLDDDELALRLDAAANLAGAELYLDRYADAGAHAERAISLARATGQSEFIPLAYSILGQVKLLRGQLAEADELLDNAVEAARLSGNVQALAGNLGQHSFAALAAGDVATALALAEECVELTSGLDRSLACAAGVALAAALVETGDPRRAVDALIASSGGDALSLIPGVWRARFLELLTRCCSSWVATARPNARPRVRGRRPRPCDCGWRTRWHIAPPRPSRWTPATPASPPSARSPRPLLPTRSACPSKPRSHGLSPAAHSPKPGSPTARWPSSNTPPPSSKPAARCDTAPAPSANCDASATAATAAPAPADPTGPASQRSPSASSRLRGSSWIAGQTRRSPKRCSSARRRSRPTCETSSASSTSPHASRSHAPSSAPIAPRTQRDRPDSRSCSCQTAPSSNGGRVGNRPIAARACSIAGASEQSKAPRAGARLAAPVRAMR